MEVSMVLEARKSYEGVRDFDLFIARAGIKLSEVDAEQAEIARTTFRKFGRAVMPLILILGIAFPMHWPKPMGSPLLFKGNDFSQTDVQRAA